MKNRSSSLTIATSGALSVLLTLLVLSIHQAYASSCFTDTGGHWAETFICWMKTTGLSGGYPDGSFRPNNYITRAEVASLLYKEASGDTYVSMGPSPWLVTAQSPGSSYIEPYPSEDKLRSNTTGTNYYHASIPMITTLHNQQMTVKGLELCYNANPTGGASIIQVEISLNNANVTPVDYILDNTVRTDRICRLYYFPSPDSLGSTYALSVFVQTSLTATTDYVDIYSATALQGFSSAAGVLAPSLDFPGTVPGATR